MATFEPGRVRAVILDMDGVLLDSERIAYAIGREVSREMGIPWRHEVAIRMIGLNSRAHERLLKDAYGEDYPVEAHHQEFGRRYEALIAAGGIPLKPGVHEFLDLLDRLGLPRVVATSTRRSRALPKLERAGLAGRIGGLVGGDEVRQGKPAPDIFLAAAGLLGVAAGHCAVVEDSGPGARGALAAGAQVLLVPDLLPPEQTILEAGAILLPTLLEAGRLLEHGRG